MEPPKLAPLLHWGTLEIIQGFHFWNPLGGPGCACWLHF